MAHGSKFPFRKDEPKREAVFRKYKITRSREGHDCLFGYISTGGVFDLLDYMKEYLKVK